MELIFWIIENFGVLFGGVFLFYLFLMIKRLLVLYDILRWTPADSDPAAVSIGEAKGLGFLSPLLERLAEVSCCGSECRNMVIEAIWCEMDRQVSVHFTALQGYVHTLILVGFAGTIFGAIGAFNTMFQGLSEGGAAATMFINAWKDGLATALYSSLGAAAIGAVVLTLLSSRYLISRAKRLEVMVALRISEVMEEGNICPVEEQDPASHLTVPRIPEKTFLPICSS